MVDVSSMKMWKNLIERHFDLHASQATPLVFIILMYLGVIDLLSTLHISDLKAISTLKTVG